jgi:hypothetical protein
MEETEMRKLWIVLALALVLVTVGAGTALAGGAKNGTLVKFNYLEDGETYYCEGYFLRTASGIVHEWRMNPECISWGMPFSNFHLVFKPTEGFEDEGWEDKGLLGCYPGEWVLDDTYVDLGGDEGDLTDFFGPRDEDAYWSCVYLWELDD